MKKLTVNKQEELFAQDCKLINLRYEYKDDLTEYIGFVDDERLWRQINAALKKTFGLWLYNTDRIGDIRCLCPKCLNDYFRNPNYVVRRLDPFAKSKGTCDKCNDRGWDYIVYDKRTSFKGKGV